MSRQVGGYIISRGSCAAPHFNISKEWLLVCLWCISPLLSMVLLTQLCGTTGRRSSKHAGHRLSLAGTQHGTTLSLPQQGLPRLGGPAAATGAHHFRVCVMLPHAEAMGEAEQQLLEQLALIRQARGRQRQRAQALQREQEQHSLRRQAEVHREQDVQQQQQGVWQGQRPGQRRHVRSRAEGSKGKNHSRTAPQREEKSGRPAAPETPAGGAMHTPLPGEQGLLRRSGQS